MSAKTWTEGEVYTALTKRFPTDRGAFAMLSQVRNGTGYQRKTRTADALVVSCWPSRGIWVGGIEIKVTLSDWRRELAEPEKADSIMRYCDYWWIAAPKGVVPVGEVPETWGLLEVSGRGVTEARPAPKQEADALDAAFVAAVLRNASDGMVATSSVQALVEEKAKELNSSREYRVRMLEDENKRLNTLIGEFEKASGVRILHQWNLGNIGEAVRALTNNPTGQLRQQLESVRNVSRVVGENADRALALLANTGDQS